jgi:tRNA dimethylallyltransferase
MQKLPKIIVIVGTNASGKSGLGVELAKRYQGEIVSADSRQVFQGLDLGSGKITGAEMQGVPHHLLDVCKAGDFFSMADFQRMAYEAIDGILARGKTPFLVGGTGLYVESVAEGYLLSGKTPDLKYRAELEAFDTGTLYAMLREVAPEVQVDPGNRNRVMRLLERVRDGDYHPPRKERRYESLRLGVTWARDTLGKRIDERLHRRMAQGMLQEVRGLLDAGVSEEFLLGLGLEYRFLTRYLKGEIGSEMEMLSLLSTAIKQFAKRQMTWFRRDREILWLDMTADPVAEAMGYVDGFLG